MDLHSLVGAAIFRSANIRIMTDYLKSGPTASIVTIPHQLVYSFAEIDRVLVSLRKKIMETIEMQRRAQVGENGTYACVPCLLCSFYFQDKAGKTQVAAPSKTIVDAFPAG